MKTGNHDSKSAKRGEAGKLPARRRPSQISFRFCSRAICGYYRHRSKCRARTGKNGRLSGTEQNKLTMLATVPISDRARGESPEGSTRRRFLFLQGPIGLFFSRLAQRLAGDG